MNPGVDDRLASMIRALEEVILPALKGHQGIAEEQAFLMLGHLHQLRAQANLVASYEEVERESLRELGTALSQAAEGGTRTQAAADQLGALVAARPPSDPSELRSLTADLGQAIDAVVGAAHRDGAPDFLAELYALILDQSARDADRDRSWFRATGFEGPDLELPPFETYLSPTA